MGKPIDSRVVEYAYVQNITIRPNQPVVPATNPLTYKHDVVVVYELKDTDKKLLDLRAITHEISAGETQATVAEYIAAVASALPAFVAADKLALANYPPA